MTVSVNHVPEDLIYPWRVQIRELLALPMRSDVAVALKFAGHRMLHHARVLGDDEDVRTVEEFIALGEDHWQTAIREAFSR